MQVREPKLLIIVSYKPKRTESLRWKSQFAPAENFRMSAHMPLIVLYKWLLSIASHHDAVKELSSTEYMLMVPPATIAQNAKTCGSKEASYEPIL
jgi:hypothetical protein